MQNRRYVDDTVLIAEAPVQLQEVIHKVNEKGKLYEMKKNVEKIKTMLISKVTPVPNFKLPWTLTQLIKKIHLYI